MPMYIQKYTKYALCFKIYINGTMSMISYNLLFLAQHDFAFYLMLTLT